MSKSIKILILTAAISALSLMPQFAKPVEAAWTANYGIAFVTITDMHWGYCGWCGDPYSSWHKNIIIKRYSWIPDKYAWIDIHHTKYNSGCTKIWESKATNACWNYCVPRWSDYYYVTQFMWNILCWTGLAWVGYWVISNVGWVAVFAL